MSEKDPIDSINCAHLEEKMTKSSSILKLISEDRSKVIPKCNGTRTILRSTKTFSGHIHIFFKMLKLDTSSNATDKTSVHIYKIATDTTFLQMLGSLDLDLDKLHLTQHQIIRYCEMNTEILCTEGLVTFFLLKKHNRFFIVAVGMISSGLTADVYDILEEQDRQWYATNNFHIVVPQPMH